ncbi:hypothetical protein JI666_13915 [Bacillus sp. NTK071]|uniref:hypothetical protein n=1 Tax=Bacillus sp. NTK071 TaxID=2802175 RepID=UPI001A8EB733|nr:hypothetical protein [Bacillus sp. NTK071]MBN8209848.1 hypothetical protein [Bacillus sp. NTK071]
MEQNNKKVYKYNYFPLFFDFLLRWLVLWGWRSDYFGSVWFWVINIFIIPFVLHVFLHAYIESKVEFKKVKPYSTEAEIEITAATILFLLSLLIAGTFVSFNLYENLHVFLKMVIAFISFVTYGMHLLLNSLLMAAKANPVNTKENKNMKLTKERTAPLGNLEMNYDEKWHPKLKQVIKFYDSELDCKDDSEFNVKGKSDKKRNLSIEIPSKDLTDEEISDSNDLEIVKLEGVLNYTNDRVNSYVLESALFSGLAFAGFITLITSTKLDLSIIPAVLEYVKSFVNSLLYFDMNLIDKQLTIMNNEYLLVIILVESLLCTLAFVSVIASRLRFSDVLEEIEISVKSAKSFNDKEEEVALLKLEKHNYDLRNKLIINEKKEEIALIEPEYSHRHLSQRIKFLNDNILKEISISNQKFESITPILYTIRVLRSLGMTFFFSMIITSAALINTVLALVIFVVSIAVTLIMNIDHSVRIKKLKRLNNIHLPIKPFLSNKKGFNKDRIG